MDGRLCLWGHNRRTGETLTGHDMSITRVIPIHPYNIAITCGYDKKACIYKFPPSDPTSIPMSTSSSSSSRSGVSSGVGRTSSTRQSTYTSSFSTSLKPYEYLIGHSEPILECIVLGPSSPSSFPTTHYSTTTSTTSSTTSASDLRVVTGDRNNILKLWDLATGDVISTYDNSSSSASSSGRGRGNGGGSTNKTGTMITCLYSYYSSFTTPNYHTKGQNYDHHRPTQFISGGMDGCIRIYDSRQDQCVAFIPAHCSTIYQPTTTATTTATTTKSLTRPSSGMKYNEDIYTSNLSQQQSSKPPPRGRNENGLRPSCNPSYTCGDGGISDLADMYHQLSLPSSTTSPVTAAAVATDTDRYRGQLSSSALSIPRKSLRPSRLLQSTTSRPVSSSTSSTYPIMADIATSRATSYTATATSTTLSSMSGTMMKGHPVTCLSGMPDDPDGHYLLSGGADGRLLLIDLRRLSSSYTSCADRSRGGCIVAEYAQHKQGVHSTSVVSNDCVYTGDGAGQWICVCIVYVYRAVYNTNLRI